MAQRPDERLRECEGWWMPCCRPLQSAVGRKDTDNKGGEEPQEAGLAAHSGLGSGGSLEQSGQRGLHRTWSTTGRCSPPLQTDPWASPLGPRPSPPFMGRGRAPGRVQRPTPPLPTVGGRLRVHRPEPLLPRAQGGAGSPEVPGSRARAPRWFGAPAEQEGTAASVARRPKVCGQHRVQLSDPSPTELKALRAHGVTVREPSGHPGAGRREPVRWSPLVPRPRPSAPGRVLGAAFGTSPALTGGARGTPAG